MSGFVGGLSGTGVGMMLMGSDHPTGGTAVYSATLSAICNTNDPGRLLVLGPQPNDTTP